MLGRKRKVGVLVGYGALGLAYGPFCCVIGEEEGVSIGSKVVGTPGES